MKSIKSITRFLAAGLCTAAVLSFSGCFDTGMKSAIGTYDFSQMHLVQLEEPRQGQPMAVIETTKGTIKAVLYPEYAPNTVSNFINRANEGYYNGKDIYGIEDGQYFMSGSFDEKRTSGATDDGKLIENEYSVNLWPFKGAICSFNRQMGYGDSRFFVINERPLTDEETEELRNLKNSDGERILPDELIDAFVEKGSFAHLAGYYTVFAQTIEGFDVIEDICSVSVSGDNLTPDEPIYINSVTVTEYSGEKSGE